MIKTELISANALKIVAPDKLKADDFYQIAPQIDSLISQRGKIRLRCREVAGLQVLAELLKLLLSFLKIILHGLSIEEAAAGNARN